MALDRAAWIERRYGAEIAWQPFDLHPEYPPEGVSWAEVERRLPEGLTAGARQLIEEAGMAYARPDRRPNGSGAQQVAELARDRGVFAPVHEALFAAYWAEGRDIGEEATLVEVGTRAGLDAGEVAGVVRRLAYRDRVQRSTDAARQLGADAIPAWLLDGELLVLGAQPHEVFEQAMGRLGHQ